MNNHHNKLGREKIVWVQFERLQWKNNIEIKIVDHYEKYFVYKNENDASSAMNEPMMIVCQHAYRHRNFSYSNFKFRYFEFVNQCMIEDRRSKVQWMKTIRMDRSVWVFVFFFFFNLFNYLSSHVYVMHLLLCYGYLFIIMNDFGLVSTIVWRSSREFTILMNLSDKFIQIITEYMQFRCFPFRLQVILVVRRSHLQLVRQFSECAENKL